MHEKLIDVVLSVSQGGMSNDAALTSLRQALVDFGSETDDNLQCAALLRMNGRKICIGSAGESLGDLLSNCEDDKVYDAIQEVVPNLERPECEALLRFCTLLLVALEEQ